MKKIVPAILVLFIVCGILLISAYGITKYRQPALLARPPLHLQEINRMAAAWDSTPAAASVAKPATGATARPEEGTAPAASLSPEALQPTKQAPALVRTLTQTERETYFHTDQARRPKDLEDKMQDTVIYNFCQIAATVNWTSGLGEAGGWYWEAGQEARKQGDLEAMRAYYREALEHPLTQYQQQWCCAKLAPLEDDPEAAGRLLEIACATDHYLWLGEALDLSKATGSDAAHKYYVERVWEAAKRLRAQGDAGATIYERLLNR